MKKDTKALAALMLAVTAMLAVGCTKPDEPGNGGNGGNNGGGKTPTVTTMSVTDITTSSAKCGGVVTNEGDGGVTERGICWSTSQMPTIYNGSHVRCGSGAGAFSGEMMDLLENTVYYVRAYATNSVGTSYGEEVPFRTEAIYTIEVLANPSEYGEVIGGGSYLQGDSCIVIATANDGFVFYYWSEDNEWVSSDATYTFSVDRDRSIVAHFAISSGDGHAYVDLGLPSGTLWATCNVGANTPEGYGDYFAWGETQPKTTYNWSTYRYCNGDYDYDQLTKYCNNSSYGYNGFTDNLTVLQTNDDAATANWGSGWCMPTRAQWEELYQNTSNTWTARNDVIGRLFTASNGHTLFLPAAGYRWYDELRYAGGSGYYWSSSLITDNPGFARYFYFNSGDYGMGNGYRSIGRSVRAVREN